MNPIPVDIKNILVKKGRGEEGGNKDSEWAIFMDTEPDKPSNAVTIYTTPGEVDKVMTGNPFLHSAFQIRVRSTDYMRAYTHIRACSSAVDRIGKFTVDDVAYNNIVIDDEPIPLPQDSQGRFIFVINGVAFRKETS